MHKCVQWDRDITSELRVRGVLGVLVAISFPLKTGLGLSHM